MTQKDQYMCRKSKFTQHLLDVGHTFGPMESVMDVIQYAWKGKMMDALERFHVYDITQRGVQINYKLTVQYNPIFDVLVRHLQYTGTSWCLYTAWDPPPNSTWLLAVKLEGIQNPSVTLPRHGTPVHHNSGTDQLTAPLSCSADSQLASWSPSTATASTYRQFCKSTSTLIICPVSPLRFYNYYNISLFGYQVHTDPTYGYFCTPPSPP